MSKVAIMLLPQEVDLIFEYFRKSLLTCIKDKEYEGHIEDLPLIKFDANEVTVALAQSIVLKCKPFASAGALDIAKVSTFAEEMKEELSTDFNFDTDDTDEKELNHDGTEGE